MAAIWTILVADLVMSLDNVLGVTDPVVADWVRAQGPWLQRAAPIAGILVVIGPAYWLKRRHSDTASNEVVP